MPEQTRLFYGHDPMCSFCWAFRPVWASIRSSLAQTHPDIQIVYVMGGLAPDSDKPMPEEMRSKLRATWQYIEQNIPGTQFNYDFWQQQQPRRSTYPSCRAVIAVNMLDAELEEQMILAIQQAYYMHAMNPSDEDTLVTCAESIGLDGATFTDSLRSRECEALFEQDRKLSRDLGISSFPSLVITRGNSRFTVPVDYNSDSIVLGKLHEAITLL